MRLRAPVAFVLTTVLAATVTLVALPAAEVSASGCVEIDPVTRQCKRRITIPGQPGDRTPGTPGEGGGGDDGPFTGCIWEPVFPDGYLEQDARPPWASEDAVYSQCWPYLNGVRGYCPCQVAWLEPGEAPQVTPEQVARSIDIAVLLKAPEIATNPPEGRPSLINNPVFVSVTNWQGTVSEDGCIGAVCVVVTAEPKLTFDPGDGSAVITCEPGGTTYTRSDGPPKDAAQAPGACAHIYDRHSGGDGRPAAWPASVTITWAVSWEGGGDAGTFDAQVQPTPFEVDVDEVHGVVTGTGS